MVADKWKYRPNEEIKWHTLVCWMPSTKLLRRSGKRIGGKKKEKDEWMEMTNNMNEWRLLLRILPHILFRRLIHLGFFLPLLIIANMVVAVAAVQNLTTVLNSSVRNLIITVISFHLEESPGWKISVADACKSRYFGKPKVSWGICSAYFENSSNSG